MRIVPTIVGLVAVGLSACTPASATSPGIVVVDTVAVAAPATEPANAAMQAPPPLVRVIESASVGSRVRTGDVIARLDPREAEARLAAARADADALGNRTGDLRVEAAEVALSKTTLTAPADGIITRALPVGSAAAPGATIVELRTGPTEVETWASPTEAAALCVGTPATITADWLSEGRPAEIVFLSNDATYPPTSYAGTDVHLTRAVRVLVRVTDPAARPPLHAGAPVDLSFGPCPDQKDR